MGKDQSEFGGSKSEPSRERRPWNVDDYRNAINGVLADIELFQRHLGIPLLSEHYVSGDPELDFFARIHGELIRYGEIVSEQHIINSGMSVMHYATGEKTSTESPDIADPDQHPSAS